MWTVIWSSSSTAILFTRFFLAAFCLVAALADVLLQAATAHTRDTEKRFRRDYRCVDIDEARVAVLYAA